MTIHHSIASQLRLSKPVFQKDEASDLRGFLSKHSYIKQLYIYL